MNTTISLDINNKTPFIVTEKNTISKGDWAKEVAFHLALFKQCRYNTYLLYEPDFYQFSIKFIALLGAGKTVVLATSGQPDYIRSIKQAFDTALLPKAITGIHCWETPNNCHPQLESSLDIAATQTVHFYTSGSSGDAKKVIKQWRQLSNEIICQRDLWARIFHQCLTVASVSHQHIYGLLFKLLIPLVGNTPIYQPLIQFPEQLGKVAEDKDNIIFISSPAYLARVAHDADSTATLARMKQIYSSGGPLLADTASLLHQSAALRPIEIYGSTETGGIGWRQQARNNSWQAFTGIKLNADHEGRLSIQSPFLASDDWYETDDIVECQSDTTFVLKGRVDRVVKLEEKRLSLTSLESILQQHADCQRAKALLLPGKRVQLAVVIELKPNTYVNSKDAGEPTLRQTIQVFRHYLSGFFEPTLLPRKWRFVSALPIDSQGKTSQNVLKEMFDNNE